MRGVEGIRVIVLSYPRNVHGDFSPMAPELFDPMSGIHAFQQGTVGLGEHGKKLQLLDNADCGLGDMDQATFTSRKKVVDCLALTLGADGEVTLQEAELLRAFVNTLGCSIPPFVNGPQKPSNT